MITQDPLMEFIALDSAVERTSLRPGKRNGGSPSRNSWCVSSSRYSRWFRKTSDIHRHGAVEEHHEIRDAVFSDQAAEMVHQFLRALDGKSWDDYVSSGLNSPVYSVTQEVFHIAGGPMVTVPISRFHHHVVRLPEDGRIMHERLVPLADIAREEELPAASVLAVFQLDHGRPQDVAGIVETGPHVPVQGDILSITDRLDEGKALLGILDGVEGHLGMRPLAALFFVSLALVCGVFFLYPGGIQPHDLHQILGSRGGQDRAGIPLPDELGEEPGMVQVTVGEKHKIEASGKYGKGFPIAGHILPFLEKAAIDQDTEPIDLHKIAGPGDLTGRSQELDPHHISPPVSQKLRRGK